MIPVDPRQQETRDELISRIVEKDSDANEGMLHGMSVETLIITAASLGIDVTDIDKNAKGLKDRPAPKQDLRAIIRDRIKAKTNDAVKPSATLSVDKLRSVAAENHVDLSDLFPGDPPAIQAPTPEPNAPIQKMECRVLKCREMFHPGYEARHLLEVHGITPDQVGTHTRGCIFGTCFKMFSSLRERNAHMDREHADVTLVRCPHPGCEDERFHNEAFLQTHLERKHHGQLPQPPAEGDTSDMTNAAATPATPAQTAPPAPATPEPIVIPLEGGEDPIFPFQPPDTGNAHVVTTRRMIPRTTAALGATTPAADRGTTPSLWSNSDEVDTPEYPGDPFTWELPDLTGFTPHKDESNSTPVSTPAPQGPMGNPNNVIGMTQKEALDWLEARNWKTSVERDWSDEPYGVVFDYGLFAGEIAIRVSKGPKPEETQPWRITEFPEMGAVNHPKAERVIRTSEANALPPIRAEVITLREDQEPETVEKAAKPSSPPANNGGGKFLGGIKKLLGALAPPSDLGN